MILTLYRNCILNDKYYEVFDTKKRGNNDKSAFVTYLEGLDNTVIEVENVYVKYYGNILLPYDVTTGITALDYNYMKIENEEQTIYAFINSIELVNQVVNLTYAQDVWANWSDKCTIRQGVLKYLNNLQNLDTARLPIDLETSEAFVPDTIKNPLTNEELDPLYDKFSIIVTYQAHDLVQGDNTETRVQRVALLTHTFNHIETDFFNSEAISVAIQNLLNYENKNCLHLRGLVNPGETDNLGYPDFISFYAIPYLDIALFEKHDVLYNTNGDYAYSLATIDQTTGVVKSIIDKTYANGDINPAIIGVGILDNIIPYNELRADISVKLELRVDSGNVNIIMYTPNSIANVTSSFEIEPMWAAISDSATEQRKISYNMQKFLFFSNSIKSGLSFSQGINSVNKNATAGDIYGYRDANIQSNYPVIDFAENAFRLYSQMKPQYQNFTPLKSTGNAVMNAIYGVRMFIMNPLNQEFIQNAIKYIGYQTQKFIENYDLGMFKGGSRLGSDQCVCSFAWLNITGEAPQNILRELENILLTSTRIWYGTIS